jgi:hypothetical protein
MNTNLKIIAALTVAVLAAPVLTGTASAETSRQARAAATYSEAHGTQTRTAQQNQTNSHGADLADCVHVAFPQCSGGN